MTMREGTLVKGVGGAYDVASNGKIFKCTSRKKTKQKGGNFMIGDHVDFDSETLTIEKVHTRKNFLIRPPIANIDNLVIIISTLPQPDFMLIDKMLIHARNYGIKPYIVINKIDLGIEDFRKSVKEDYKNAVEEIFEITTFEKETTKVLNGVLASGITCLVGQSAVGKTSLLNIIKVGGHKREMEVGELSKNKRGKHTTRHSEIWDTIQGGYVIDTPGFSFLDIDIDEAELMHYYPDFFKYQNECYYGSCMHIKEPKCMVKQKLEEGEISKNRYERYLKIYEEMKKRRENKYG
ncbi:MAG: ribosome small subunit-dependent GTPase A [Bacillota bacterium]